MPLIPDNLDVVARYVYYKSHIRSSNKTVKYAAFLPNPKDNKTSVYRVSGLSEDKIWDIAACHVSQNQENPLQGRADLNVSDIVKSKLSVIPNEPPYRHADITDWHYEKSKQVLAAKILEKNAMLHLVP